MLSGDVGPGARCERWVNAASEFGAGAGPLGDRSFEGKNSQTIGRKVIRGAALVGKDDGDMAGEGFGHDHAEGFVGGGVDEDVDLAEEILRVGAAEDLGALRQGPDKFSWQ